MASALRLRRSRGGFTLFEILGAVTILAIVYSWLASSAMQGMRSEGLSKRRLEASLLVDEEMMKIETGLAAGLTPDVGVQETSLDDVFRLVVEVSPFDPTPFLGEALVPEDGEEPVVPTLLVPPTRPQDALLRLVDVRVLWDEGDGELEVARTTLVYDVAQIAELFPEEGAEGEQEEEDDEELSFEEQFLGPDGKPDVQKMLEALGAGS
ncbi:MAG: type IV pilus modification PilV family protein [Myxococcota bacterium]